MKNKKILLIVTFLLAVACGSKQQCPTITPFGKGAALNQYSTSIDPDIARIYSNTPITGVLPRNIKWSKDSKTLSYLRMTYAGEVPTKSLWLTDTVSFRDRPLISGTDFQIDEYSWLNEKEILVVSNGDLYTFDADGKKKQIGKPDLKASDVKVSPNGKQIAFVKDNNIFVIKTHAQNPIQITKDGNADTYYGGVSWIYGEEFSTANGFGWSPDSQKLWFYQVDETKVTKRTLITNSDGNSRMQAYPRAGEPNPIVKVAVADLSQKEASVKWIETGEDTDVYLPRVTWHPNSKQILITKFDRLQTEMNLLSCSAKSKKCQSIVQERDPRCVNHLDGPVFHALRAQRVQPHLPNW